MPARTLITLGRIPYGTAGTAIGGGEPIGGIIDDVVLVGNLPGNGEMGGSINGNGGLSGRVNENGDLSGSIEDEES